MNKLKPFVFVVLTFLMTFFVSCGDSLENDKSGMVVGSIHGIVTDESSNNRLDSVVVSWAHNSKLKFTQTNSLGYYAISNLSTGSYELTFSKDSVFATGRISVTIPSFQDLGVVGILPENKDYPYSEVQDMELYGLTSGLTGLVYKTEDVENTTLVDSGVKVIADFSNYDISPNEYTVQTDGFGRFDFTSLPATGGVNVKVLPFNDGFYDYSMGTSYNSLIPNEKTNANNIIMNISPAAPFIVQNNYENNDFSLDSDIIISFSKFMNQNSFEISLYSYNYENVQFESSWTNYTTLNIDPLVVLQAKTTYYLNIAGSSLDNNSFSGNYVFSTIEGINFVSTNLEHVDGVFNEFPIASNIELVFSLAVDWSTYGGFVSLYDSYNNVTVGKPTVTTNKVIFNPTSDLEFNEDYNIS